MHCVVVCTYSAVAAHHSGVAHMHTHGRESAIVCTVVIGAQGFFGLAARDGPAR